MSKNVGISVVLSLSLAVLGLAGCSNGGGNNDGTVSPSGFMFGSQGETSDFSNSVAGEASAQGPFNMAADGAALTENGLDVTDPDVWFDEDGNAVITFIGRTETAPLNGFDGAHSDAASGLAGADTYSLLLSYYRASDNRLTRPQTITAGDSTAMPTRPVVMFNGEASTTTKRGDAVIVFSQDTDAAAATATEQDLFYTVLDASIVTSAVNGFTASATNVTSVSAGNNVKNYLFASDGNNGLVTTRRTGTLTTETQPIAINYNRVSNTDTTTHKAVSSSLLGVAWLQDIAASETLDTNSNGTDDTAGTDDGVCTGIRGSAFTWSGTTTVGSFGSITDIYMVSALADDNGTIWRVAESDAYDISPGLDAGTGLPFGNTTGTTTAGNVQHLMAAYNTSIFVVGVDDEDDEGASGEPDADEYDILWLTTTLTSTGFSTIAPIEHGAATHASTDAIDINLVNPVTAIEPVVFGTDDCSSATGVYMCFAGNQDQATANTDYMLLCTGINASTGAVGLTPTVMSRADNTTTAGAANATAWDNVTAIMDAYVGRSGAFACVMFNQDNNTNVGDLPYLNELKLNQTLGTSPLQGVVQLWASTEAGLTQSGAGADIFIDGGAFQRDVQSSDTKLSMGIMIRDEDLDGGADGDDEAREKNRLIFNQYAVKTPGGAGTDITALAVSAVGASSAANDGGGSQTQGISACSDAEILDGGTVTTATSAIVYYTQRDTSGTSGADATSNTADDVISDAIFKAAKFNGTSIEATQVTLSTASTGLDTTGFDANVPQTAYAPSTESRDNVTEHVVVFQEERAASTHTNASEASIRTAIRSRIYTLSATWGATAFTTPTTWYTNITASTATNHNDVDGGGNVQTIWHSWQDISNTCAMYWIESDRVMYSLLDQGTAWSTPNDVGNPNAGAVNSAFGTFGGGYAPSNISSVFLDSSATNANGTTLLFVVQRYGLDGAGADFHRAFAKVIR